MNASLEKTNNKILLQIPEGDRFELKIEEGVCSFYLNQAIIEQIQQAKENSVSLEIPPKLIIYLWYYSCFSSHLVFENQNSISQNLYLRIFQIFFSKTAQQETSLQSGINFNSYYKHDNSASDTYEDEDIILQTTVIFNGDIFHKIKHNFLQNSNFSKVVSAHYWLTEQLISSLQIQPNLLIWEIASSFTAGFVVYNLNPANAMLSIFTWLGLTILFATTRYVLANQFKRLTSINSKFINWLAWALVCLIPTIAIGGIHGFTEINVLLLPLLSVIAPKLVEYILSFIQPRVGKLILRQLLF
ncbi:MULTISPECIES: hypothetical protein [Nostoc]|uniref:Uncharacterized protein n=1 Tax=Nostoc paludosum FACHB-159 TaxID=2692908 RepID=A0ABR8K3L8_9NOSO|nr:MULTISPECIES: hypothetical protein [Nostoc]MBD2678276.1 hypothetical protein [Nostoc sp. FACHB-857]MBD2733394.1 hypothetical protein [Nostoc paludosum FACHB-159]